MVIEILVAAVSGGAINIVYNRFFMSKKEQKDYTLQLLATLGEQVERIQKQYETMQLEFNSLMEKYNALLKEYNTLQMQHNQLKQDFNKLKQQTIN